MKKHLTIGILAMLLLISSLFAEEAILFSSSAKADLDGYDYVSNFEITSNSGYFTKDNLKILAPNDKGLRFFANNVPKDTSTSYLILVAYPSFLNESGIGAGNIYNASSIKSIKVTATTNRPYDEIILLYSTSPTGEVKEIKMPQNFNRIRSMEEFTLFYENPLYEADVSKRELETKPVLGADADGIYLRGFRIKTNAPTGFSAYSEYSVIYLKEVAIVYDKAFTDEQLEASRILKEEFGIDENKAITEKAKSEVAEKNRIRELNKSLMDAQAK